MLDISFPFLPLRVTFIHATCYNPTCLHDHIPTCPHTTRLTLQLGGCCFFNQQKWRNSTFSDWFHLASPDLEAALEPFLGHLHHGRLNITWHVIAPTLCGMINFEQQINATRPQYHIWHHNWAWLCTTMSILIIMSDTDFMSLFKYLQSIIHDTNQFGDNIHVFLWSSTHLTTEQK